MSDFSNVFEPPPRRRIVAPLSDPPDPAQELLFRFLRASACGIRLLMRQSSPGQARYARGSGLVQEHANLWVARYGVDPATVVPVDARGESGRRGRERRIFKDLADAAIAKQFAVLILPVFDRVGRHMAASCGLFDALADAHGFLLTEHRLFDLRNPDDMADAREKANEAERQNEARRAQHIACRKALAHECALRFNLPSGLVWAVPGESYRTALRATGRTDLVDMLRDARERWECWTATRDGIMLPLWYPDRDVIRTARQRIEWLLETASLTAVMDRISESSEWPASRTGLVPVVPGWRWRPDLVPLWLKPYRDYLRRWLGNPSVYGIYSFMTGANSGSTDRTNPDRATVFERDAFPAFGTSLEFDEVRRILLAPDPLNVVRRYRSGGMVGTLWLGASDGRSERCAPMPTASSADAEEPRVEPQTSTGTQPEMLRSPGAIANATPIGGPHITAHSATRRRIAIFDDNWCAHPLAPGVVCGRRLQRNAGHADTPAGRSGLAWYTCHLSGHPTAIRFPVYRATLCAVVAESLDTSDLAETIDRLALTRSASIQDLHRVRREMDRLASLITAAGESEDSARAERDNDAVKDARDRRRKYAAERDALQTQERSLTVELEAEAAMLQLDLEQVRVAVRSARDLLTAPDAPAHLVRRVVAACVRNVWIRSIGVGAHEIDVEFKTGVTVRRHVLSTAPRFPQPVWAYAWARSREAMPPVPAEAIGDTVAALRAVRDLPQAPTVFHAGNVPACAAAYDAWRRDDAPWSPPQLTRPRLGPGWSADQLAIFTEDDATRLLAVGLAGEFGPAYTSGTGDVVFAPTISELHWICERYAARTAEQAAGWAAGSAIAVRRVARVLPFESSTFRAWPEAAAGAWATDAIGRRYVHRDGPYAAHVHRFLDAARAVDPGFVDLDLDHWRSIRVASRKLGVPRAMILAVAPTVAYRFGKRGAATTYVWTGPRVRAALARQLLSAAAQAHGFGGADEFHTIAAIRAHFGRLGVSFHPARTRQQTFRGVIVTAPIEHRREERGRYFHVPASVWTSNDAVVVRSWVGQHGTPVRRRPIGPSNLGDPLIGHTPRPGSTGSVEGGS